MQQNISAQTLSLLSGESVVIKGGAEFFIEGVTLLPNADFTINGASSINIAASPSHSTLNNSIQRVIGFSNTTSPFSGTVQFRYSDGELNNLPEASLQLNIHNGGIWQAFPTNSHDVAGNILTSAALSSVTLNELTLASQTAALPLNGLTFSASVQRGNVQLQWKTMQEEGTQDFVLEHSGDGRNFIPLTTLNAAGWAAFPQTYGYVHANAPEGLNYYRLLQRDRNGNQRYSSILSVQIKNHVVFSLLNKQTRNGMLYLQVFTPVMVQLIDNGGRVVLQQKLAAGHAILPVSNLSKGIYYLTGSQQMERIIIE